jgi:alkylation response protein AidB-like acyl-CoA dehydrogenase
MAHETDPLVAARSLAELIEGEAAAADESRLLTPPVIDAFTDAGLFALLVPRELGGMEADAPTALAVFEELSRADGSTGWSFLANATSSAMAAVFTGDAAVKEMFGGSGPVIAAGMLGPRGKAEVVDGGYLVRGRHSFGSGIGYANWVGAGMFVTRDGEFVLTPSGGRENRVVYVPRANVELKGNWDVVGLSATGSFDYELPEQFVDEAFTFPLADPIPRRGGSVYHLGVMSLSAIGHCGFALGVARRAIEEIAKIAPTRMRMVTPTAAPMRLADQPLFRHDAGFHEAAFRSVRAYAFEAFGDAQAAVERGDAPTVEQHHRLLQVTTYATRVAVDIVRFAFEAAGSSGLRNGPLQRCLCDISAGNQHVYVDSATLMDAAPVVLATYA